MPNISRRALTLVEAVGLGVCIAAYIWKLQTTHPNFWMVFPLWLVASFAVHRDNPKTLGWRADNLWSSVLLGWKIFLAFAAAAVAAAFFFGAYRHWPPHFAHSQRFLGYFAFCLLQQVGLNSYMTNRLVYALESSTSSSLLTAFIFAALHWPNPVLVPLTFVGGALMSWLFAKERNIIPLAFGQAIIGALVWWAVPVAWHHGMRVGPGFYSFHP